jgi:hypothetical protein
METKREVAPPAIDVPSPAIVVASAIDAASTAGDGGANRRWFIGIGISLVFGLFGAVMALLSYADRTTPPARPAVTVVAPAAAPAPPAQRGRGKGHGRE